VLETTGTVEDMTAWDYQKPAESKLACGNAETWHLTIRAVREVIGNDALPTL
jgi:hypothetical protein